MAKDKWAKVPLLAFLEKEIPNSEYEVKHLNLISADNFDPSYVKINPNGTVPSLVVPGQNAPLTESSDILAYIDRLGTSTRSLIPQDAEASRLVNQAIELVHSDRMSTNTILLGARDPEEMKMKQASLWKSFATNRQERLQHWISQTASPTLFYDSKLKENTPLYSVYTSSNLSSTESRAFYDKTQAQYRGFAAGLQQLNDLIVLPYIAGDSLTNADLHVVPWLAHGMWGAGSTNVDDFETTERLIAKSVPGFKFGPKIKEWWAVMMKRKSFRTIYPELN